MPTAKQDKTRKNGLTVKDLIVMGVFGALLMVCSMIGGVLFAVTPTLTFYFSIGAALLPGPVFLLLLAKVPKRWGLTIIGVIISLLSLIMGMHWGMCVGGLIGAFLADMIAGSIIIEQVFSIPGMGRLMITSISTRDYPVVQAAVLYITSIVVIINFLVDILYQLADPRVRTA